MKDEYENKVFRLSGPEGCDFSKMKVACNSWSGNNGQLNFFVKVVGFRDKGADWRRSWGHRTFDDFVEKPKIKYRNRNIFITPKLTFKQKLLSLFHK